MTKFMFLYYKKETDAYASVEEIEADSAAKALKEFYARTGYFFEPKVIYDMSIKPVFCNQSIPPAYQQVEFDGVVEKH